tara:strand:+ start:900 stop:1280 length:381 start_codon:yes stop_codon:yes gene_type:complete
MFDKKMFIDTLKVSPEANLDTFGRVRKINEDKEKNNPLTVHINGKGIPSGAVRSDTIPSELKKHLPPNHSTVDPAHIGRKGVTVVSWEARYDGKNRHHIAAVMPNDEADEAGRSLGSSMRASGRID